MASATSFNRLGLGVNDPVFSHAVLLVEVAFGDAVAWPGAGGDDLDHQIRGAPKTVFDDAQSFVGDEHHVGLGDVVLGQHHVHGGGDRLAQLTGPNPGLEQVVEAVNDFLVKK
jgi:hypothetical protein